MNSAFWGWGRGVHRTPDTRALDAAVFGSGFVGIPACVGRELRAVPEKSFGKLGF